MMLNLFSIFDPSSNINKYWNWISMFTPLMFLPLKFFISPSRIEFLWNIILMKIFIEFNSLMKNKKNSNNMIIFISMMIMILLMNFLGLFPYIYTPTSHPWISMSLSLPIWISLMLYGWIFFFIDMMAHLVPNNTPPILMPFMVVIESISNIIRPLTLSIRLTANMIAGHLLLSLMGNNMNNSSTFLIPILIIIQNLLMILEMSVAMIQSYVFSTLTILYSNEI